MISLSHGRVHGRTVFDCFDDLCRHTFASLLAQQPDIKLEKVSKWLGHKDLNTTLKYYANLKTDVYDADIDRL